MKAFNAPWKVALVMMPFLCGMAALSVWRFLKGEDALVLLIAIPGVIGMFIAHLVIWNKCSGHE